MILIGIVAMDPNRGIGYHGKLPWHIPEELKMFRTITFGYPVLMGRKTWESLPKPLEGRRNIVLSHDHDYNAPGAEVIKDFSDLASMVKDNQVVYVIGGLSVYKQCFPIMDSLLVSHIREVHNCDVFFPEFAHLFSIKRLLLECNTFDLLHYSNF